MSFSSGKVKCDDKYCFRVKLSHIEHVFVTHGSWDNIGGLTGEFAFWLLHCHASNLAEKMISIKIKSVDILEPAKNF